jgi:hypothetical protein
MKFHKNLAVLALLVPLAMLPAACGDKDNRDAAQDQELDRDLNLALKGDTTQGVFEDTTQGLAPNNEGNPAPSPSPTTRRTGTTPSPSPVRRTTDRTPAPGPVAREPRTVSRTAPAGSEFSVTLNQTLSTRSNTAGDGFTATLQDPIMDTEGNVLVPAGATVHGRVTGVHASGNVTETGVINLALESISFGGHSYPLDASVVEAHAERVTRQTTAQQAGKVAAGAAAGAVLGRVLGKNTKSTIKGAVIGAAAGTAVAMGTADVDAVLRQGSTMRVRLDGPITVRRTVS